MWSGTAERSEEAMNQIVTETSLQFSTPVTTSSPELQKLFDIIALGASERDRDRIHPFEAVELIRRARLGALRIPVAQGGGGGALRDVFEVALKLAEADTNVAHILRNHFTFVERFVIGQTGETHQKWLKAVVDGAIFGLASTELDRKQVGGGGDFHTTLTPENDGFRLNGTKYYSTGTLYADYILVRATAPGGVQASIVIPAEREGVERVDDWDGVGQRVTGTGTTNFHNVRVEADELLFDSDGSPYLLPYTSTIAQLFVTTVNAGIIRAALRDAKALVKSRTRTFYYAPTETPVDDPILQQTIGQIASNAFAAEATVLAAASKLDIAAAARARGELEADAAHEASLAAAKTKVIVDELALRSASLLFDVGGASAATHRQNLDRHWRNARTLASHNPATYKAWAIGGYELNGARLPTKGFF